MAGIGAGKCAVLRRQIGSRRDRRVNRAVREIHIERLRSTGMGGDKRGGRIGHAVDQVLCRSDERVRVVAVGVRREIGVDVTLGVRLGVGVVLGHAERPDAAGIHGHVRRSTRAVADFHVDLEAMLRGDVGAVGINMELAKVGGRVAGGGQCLGERDGAVGNVLAVLGAHQQRVVAIAIE